MLFRCLHRAQPEAPGAKINRVERAINGEKISTAISQSTPPQPSMTNPWRHAALDGSIDRHNSNGCPQTWLLQNRRVHSYTAIPSHSCSATCQRRRLRAREYSVKDVEEPVLKSTG